MEILFCRTETFSTACGGKFRYKMFTNENPPVCYNMHKFTVQYGIVDGGVISGVDAGEIV